MHIVVFSGPTIGHKEATAILKADYRPPARRGDVYQASKESPKAIAVIDGYFNQTASIWHKEILWAMNEGIHVFGSSSMGALRAAELSMFGMQGVGKIFQDYNHGIITSDDEVAVLHGPPELNYLSLSEPLVNIRSTLLAAIDQHVISTQTAIELLSLSKKMFYPDRKYDHIIKLGIQKNLKDSELKNFTHWVNKHAVDQKKTDAIELINLLRKLSTSELPPKKIEYKFQNTDMWQCLISSL